MTNPRNRKSSRHARRESVARLRFANDSCGGSGRGKASSRAALLERAIFFLHLGGQSLRE
jgi:hypothetical protein